MFYENRVIERQRSISPAHLSVASAGPLDYEPSKWGDGYTFLLNEEHDLLRTFLHQINH